MEIRRLTEKEVELKPCQVAKDLKWVQLLCYKTARADQAVLDETFGLNWKSDYKEIGGVLYCTISVYNKEIGEWVSRTDAGDTGNDICVEKSQASSAFKRAATQFGIGRFLYNSPTIFINLTDSDCKNGKLTQKFYISEMEIDDKDEFTKLIIVDKWGKERFNLTNDGNVQSVPQSAPKSPKIGNNASIAEQIKAFCAAKKTEEGINKEELKKFYNFYTQRAGTWRFKKFNGDTLWTSWMSNARAS